MSVPKRPILVLRLRLAKLLALFELI